MQFDVLFVADLRFPGGTSTSIASEVRALTGAGYRIGLLSLATGPLSARRPIHLEIQALADEGLASFVPPHQPVTAELTLLHHPAVFQMLPATPLRVTSHRSLLVVHHPAVDAVGVVQYDTEKVAAVVAAQFGPVEWAPVGPKVRQTLERLATPPPMTAEDWVNVIDPQAWAPTGPGLLQRGLPVIGRHSRPEREKWPDNRADFLAAYPDASDLAVRLMGYSKALDEIVGPRPTNWEVLPFGALPVRDFLHTLDYFSYFHGSTWIEAFGRSVLEAMASDLVCLLPADFREVFGDGAVYCGPDEVADQVRRLERDPAARASILAAARKVVADRYGPAVAVARVASLIGGPRTRVEPATTGPTTKPLILYLTSNGVGMGHLARCLASARRLSTSVEPVIITMSKAFGVVRDEGFAVEYLAYFRSLDIPIAFWSAKLAEELSEILAYYAPTVLVFDGNVPFDGLLEVLRAQPQMWKVWQRRPLWRPDTGEIYLDRSGAFDVVIEPGELAAPVDRGLTTSRNDCTVHVPPIRFLDVDEALPRSTARAILGLDPVRPTVLLQLGSGNNFDFRSAAQMVFDLTGPAGRESELQVVFATWRISEAETELPAYVRPLDTFPISRYLAAFDFAVASAGYNTFHENIAAALPTLFIGNDHPEQDEQWLRAEYGALRGLSLRARANDTHSIRRGLEELLQPEIRAALAAACAKARPRNGAMVTAQFLEGLAVTRKASVLPFRVLPPEATG